MGKSADAFRTISEVADWLGVPAHVLRFWESKFTQVKPVKRAGGRRYYRPADMRLLGGIRKLLHDEGMTIKGVQKIMREQGVRHVAEISPPLGDEPDIMESRIALDVAQEPPQERGTVLPFERDSIAPPGRDKPQQPASAGAPSSSRDPAGQDHAETQGDAAMGAPAPLEKPAPHAPEKAAPLSDATKTAPPPDSGGPPSQAPQNNAPPADKSAPVTRLTLPEDPPDDQPTTPGPLAKLTRLSQPASPEILQKLSRLAEKLRATQQTHPIP